MEIIDKNKAVFNIEALQKRQKELGLLEDVECEVLESKFPDSVEEQLKHILP